LARFTARRRSDSSLVHWRIVRHLPGPEPGRRGRAKGSIELLTVPPDYGCDVRHGSDRQVEREWKTDRQRTQSAARATASCRRVGTRSGRHHPGAWWLARGAMAEPSEGADERPLPPPHRPGRNRHTPMRASLWPWRSCSRAASSRRASPRGTAMPRVSPTRPVRRPWSASRSRRLPTPRPTPRRAVPTSALQPPRDVQVTIPWSESRNAPRSEASQDGGGVRITPWTARIGLIARRSSRLCAKSVLPTKTNRTPSGRLALMWPVAVGVSEPWISLARGSNRASSVGAHGARSIALVLPTPPALPPQLSVIRGHSGSCAVSRPDSGDLDIFPGPCPESLGAVGIAPSAVSSAGFEPTRPAPEARQAPGVRTGSCSLDRSIGDFPKWLARCRDDGPFTARVAGTCVQANAATHDGHIRRSSPLPPKRRSDR
jgi:hypothetical protein